jgi:hypothetical protein
MVIAGHQAPNNSVLVGIAAPTVWCVARAAKEKRQR